MKIKIYSKNIIFKDTVDYIYHLIKSLNYKVSITDKIINNDNLYILIGVNELL